MSAELIESQFVRRLSSIRRPSVHVAIISKLNAQILGCFFNFWKIFFFLFFLRIFFVSVNMGRYGSENFTTLLLLQIAAESFQTFPEFSS